MNPWGWNQQRQQQLLQRGASPHFLHQQAPLFYPGLNFIPLQNGLIQQQRLPMVPVGPVPRQWQRAPNFPGPAHRHRQRNPNNRSRPYPKGKQNFPQNVTFPAQMKLVKHVSYQVEEIQHARKALGNFLDQTPASMKSWEPLEPDSRPNLWEGESGMMEHITLPFPLPVQGQVTSGASIWQPQNDQGGGQSVETSVNDVNSSTDTNIPISSAISKDDKSSEDDVVSVSDDDSDVQIVAQTAEASNSQAIVIEDSPIKIPTKKKKKKKKKKGAVVS